ncbi:alpha-amylase family glycosyl hydrolase [Blastopirellula marina]|uniref:Sugar phosphorylase n=1 Tax=Blastopirellula marina TaxID=124 RepID=A0A2S8FN22_9BACT|nr:alpha-amylase family glycosyl hydrolase [Blastopirellula marina]PQO33573.1 sugar phosphorylase [Blastopirellula marina]PTL43360.1 sugar phosphorylase [Blastopirellula marina]
MVGSSQQHNQLKQHLARMYGEPVATDVLPRLLELLETYSTKIPEPKRTGWDETDVVLITYADQISGPEHSEKHPLAILREFLVHHGYQDCINTVHLLPFYPYTSDDGFSVVDYKQVDPNSGDWQDVLGLAEDFNLAFDLVANHCSQQSEWFQKYLAGEKPYDEFFIDVDPATDLSMVVRPRALPLLTPFPSADGEKHVWTTFSPDQVDLNYGNPEVLLAMTDVLLFYVQNGARIIRLDAIAFLWKTIGSTCLHLDETHEAVKLLRTVTEIVAPHVLLLTETNVPHPENVSYFGLADEAHMVYQFSLPPLLYDAYLNEDATVLSRWMESLYDIPPGTTYFNFTASHDGIGVRPLEGLVPQEHLDKLVTATNDRGGLVGMRTMPDGTQRPYELNITYVDAMGQPGDFNPEHHAARFLASQAIMLAMKGIPGIYFHSLVGTRNHIAGVEESGIPRRINRRKFERLELENQIAAHDSLQHRIFAGYQKLLRTRVEQSAFHPDGASEVFPTGHPSVFGFKRTSPDREQTILILANLTERLQQIPLGDPKMHVLTYDLISDAYVVEGQGLTLDPYQIVWLTEPDQ